MDWFLYDWGICHERVKVFLRLLTLHFFSFFTKIFHYRCLLIISLSNMLVCVLHMHQNCDRRSYWSFWYWHTFVQIFNESLDNNDLNQRFTLAQFFKKWFLKFFKICQPIKNLDIFHCCILHLWIQFRLHKASLHVEIVDLYMCAAAW